MPSLMPTGKQQFFIPGTATPLVGGQLYTYAAGTSTPKTTWQDAAGTTANTNPITLDSTGSALVFWSGSYKIVLKDAAGNTVYTVDNYVESASQLSSTSGSAMIGDGTDTVKGALDALRVTDYATLRAYSGPQKSAYITGYLATSAPSGIAGAFTRDDNDTTTADNGGTVIVANGKRWKRQFSGGVDPRWFGALCDGVTDDTAPFQAAINSNGPGNPVAVRFGIASKVKISRTVYLPPLATVDLNGSVLYGAATNVMFESGYWLNGAVVSNFGQANETQIVYSTWVFNGQITNCDKAFHLFNFCEGSRVEGIRFTSVNQAVFGQRCFYGSFRKLIARSPLDGTKYPCYNLSDSVNAIECESVFAVNYTLGWQLDGSKDNFLGINCGAESCTTGVKVLNSTSAAKFLGWYFENTPTAFNFDAGGNHTNIDIENCWFNTVTTAVTGSTILTGRFRANNRLGSAALSLGANFSNGLVVEIPNDTTANTATPALPAGYTLGDTVRVDYVKAIYDSVSGLVTNKGEIHAGMLPMRYSGGSGLPKSGTVPFCTVTVTATQITIDTQISYMNLEMIGYAIQVTDGGPINLCGRITFMTVLPDTGFATKTVATVNNNGYLRLTITGLTAATACTGIVRHLG